MNLKVIFALSFFFLLSQSYGDLISKIGTKSFVLKDATTGEIRIAPIDDKDGMLSFVVEYPNKVQGGMNLKVTEGKWRAFFEKPNKLWVYDGDGALHLSEMTLDPRKFKASSSTKVPALLKKAPKEIKELIPK